jgi:hypothetical protein
MESVWLLLGGGLRRWSGRSGWVFVARGRFAVKTPPMRVGFPWISLDSLVRIETFQWVTQLEAGNFFLGPFPWRYKRRKGSRGRGHAEAQDCSWRKLNPVSDFLQEIVVRAVPLRPPQSKSSSLWRMVTAPLEDEVLALYPADRFHNQHQFCALRSCPRRARRGRWAPAVNKARIGRRAGRDRRRRRGGRLHASQSGNQPIGLMEVVVTDAR